MSKARCPAFGAAKPATLQRQLRSTPKCRSRCPEKRLPRLSLEPLPAKKSTLGTPEINPNESRHVPEDKFDWYSQWYPIAIVSDLDPTKPTGITILSMPLVIWKSPHGWSVFHDRCPHRFAALSEGRISESGNLECGYHGWQFSHSGACARIPQSPAPTPSDLSCAQSVKSTIRGDLLFVWLGEKASPPDTGPPVVEGARGKYVTSSYSRTLPLCFTTLMQNVLDPAHIHFAHHDQLGHRDLAVPVPIRILVPHAIDGFTADYYSGNVRLRFRPPSMIEIVTASGLSFAYYAVPIRAGLVRTFAVRATARRPLLRTPRWLDHMRRNSLMEDDLQLMITQENEMRRIAKVENVSSYAGTWEKYHMPTTADRLILEMRRWLDVHAPNGEDWFSLSEAWNEGDERFRNRSDGHVKACAACSKALQNCKVVEEVARAILVLSACASTVVQDVRAKCTFIAISLVFTSIFVISRRIQQLFQ